MTAHRDRGDGRCAAAPDKKPKRTFDRAGGDNPQRGLGASGFVIRGGDLAKEEDRKRRREQEEK